MWYEGGMLERNTGYNRKEKGVIVVVVVVVLRGRISRRDKCHCYH